MDFAGNRITAMMNLWHTLSYPANGKLSIPISAEATPKDLIKAVAALRIDTSISEKDIASQEDLFCPQWSRHPRSW
jgi:hypothetical protein